MNSALAESEMLAGAAFKRQPVLFRKPRGRTKLGEL
jgi:hypothetical protein